MHDDLANGCAAFVAEDFGAAHTHFSSALSALTDAAARGEALVMRAAALLKLDRPYDALADATEALKARDSLPPQLQCLAEYRSG